MQQQLRCSGLSSGSAESCNVVSCSGPHYGSIESCSVIGEGVQSQPQAGRQLGQGAAVGLKAQPQALTLGLDGLQAHSTTAQQQHTAAQRIDAESKHLWVVIPTPR